jgi:hypothetical protein
VFLQGDNYIPTFSNDVLVSRMLNCAAALGSLRVRKAGVHAVSMSRSEVVAHPYSPMSASEEP